MASGTYPSDYVSWSVEHHPMRITYSRRVMDALNEAAWDGLQKIPRRGLEVGGVLFGDRTDDEIRIRDWRPIPCEHARGPGFELSPVDEEGLAELLERSRTDPDLYGLVPLGWFHTHTKDEILLSEADIDLFDRFFPASWQVALVLRPHMYEPTRGGFFFRERNGSLRADATYREFQLGTRSRRLPVGFDPSNPQVRTPLRTGTPEAITPSPLVSEPPPPGVPRAPERRAPLPLVPDEPIYADRPRRMWPTRGRALIVAALIVLPVMVILVAPLFDAAGPGGVRLSAREEGNHLLVEWDHSAEEIALAERGRLQLLDGTSEYVIELDREELRTGSLTYERQTGDVQIRLELFPVEGDAVSEITRFLGPPAPADSAPDVQSGEPESGAAQADLLRDRLANEANRNAELQRTVDGLRERLRAP